MVFPQDPSTDPQDPCTRQLAGYLPLMRNSGNDWTTSAAPYVVCPYFVPGLPLVILIEFETGPDFVPGLPHGGAHSRRYPGDEGGSLPALLLAMRGESSLGLNSLRMRVPASSEARPTSTRILGYFSGALRNSNETFCVLHQQRAGSHCRAPLQLPLPRSSAYV